MGILTLILGIMPNISQFNQLRDLFLSIMFRPFPLMDHRLSCMTLAHVWFHYAPMASCEPIQLGYYKCGK